MKLFTVRETRDGIPQQNGLYAFTDQGALIVQAGNQTSILRGVLADWVRAHLINTAETEATLTPGPDGAAVASETVSFTAEGWPTGPTVPVPDLPRVPTSVADWREAIAKAPDATIPPLEPIQRGEPPSEYGARVLTPLGITIAQVAKAGMLESIAMDADDPEWAVILAAAGVKRTAVEGTAVPVAATILTDVAPPPPQT
jgi:hypothetical protein